MSESKKAQFFGEKGFGATAMEKNVRIVPTMEVFALIESFQKKTGLGRPQFAINGWGYPFIPIPEVKKGYGHMRMAPKNVSPNFLGHPIYWIHPELTKKKSNESEQEWCIRMFYLIDGFGYWDEHLRWIDYLEINEFSYSKAQIETYHRIADANAETDSYGLLEEPQLDISLDDVQEKYNQALVKCFGIQKRESIEMLKSQGKQLFFAQEALGDRVYEWSVDYKSEDGLWSKAFLPHLTEIAETYNRRSEEGNEIVSDLQKKTRKIYDALVDVIVRFNHATSILELPVKASIKGNPGGAARIAFIASSMAIANSQDNLRKTTLKYLEEGMRESFSRGNIGVGGFDPVLESMSKEYAKAWNRLRLAYINYKNLQEGKQVFSSVVELNASLQGDPGANSTAMEDLRKEFEG